MLSFQLSGLLPEQFEHLFALSHEQLASRGMRRVTADSNPGFPCRISLRDAEPGDELLLLSFEHQPETSPYRGAGPVYVGVRSQPATLQPGEIPSYVTLRQVSVRGYDVEHMMRVAEVCPGEAAAAEIRRQFDDPRVAYIHLHNAKRGCFSCRVDRVREAR